MKKKYLYFVLLVTVLISSCNITPQRHEDDFYNNTGSWDSLNLPLLKPYFLILINKDYGWQLPLKGNFPEGYENYHILEVTNVTKVAVKKGIIMAYTPSSIQDLHWFVISPYEKNSEIGFKEEYQFIDHIQRLGIIDFDWVNPDFAFEEFYKTGCFDWIPDCG